MVCYSHASHHLAVHVTVDLLSDCNQEPQYEGTLWGGYTSYIAILKFRNKTLIEITTIMLREKK